MAMRLFVSVPIPAAGLRPLLDDLRAVRGVRPVRGDMLHLTLCFIGDADEHAIGAIGGCMHRAVAGMRAVEAGIRDVGVFPGTGRPRVVWAGIDDPDGTVAAVAAALRRELDAADVRYDRKPFRPHITVGRTDGRADLGDVLARHAGRGFGRFAFDAVSLMSSELLPSGAAHTAVLTERLA